MPKGKTQKKLDQNSPHGHEIWVVLWFSAVILSFFGIVSVLNDHVVYSAVTAASIPSRPEISEGLFLSGEAIYQKQCAACHGVEGKGDGKAAYLLYPRPRDFASGEFRLVSTIDAGPTEEDLFKTITRGMPGSAMPSWGHLTEEERWGLVYYVRYLMEYGKNMNIKKFRDEVMQTGLNWEKKKELISEGIPPESIIQIPAEPPADQEALARGRELYLKACAGCHGQEGRGDGQQEMINTDGIPTKPRDLTSGLFKGYPSSQELYYRMMAGLPGSPMPSYQYSLTQQEIWDIIYYVQTLSDPEKEKHALAVRHQIKAEKILAESQLTVESDVWKDVEPTYVSVTPLWWRNERIEGIDVKALHNGDELAIWLQWKDPTKEDAVNAPQLFSDGVAVQFSTDSNPPFFAMGETASPVTIWNWKASWQAEQGAVALGAWPDIENRYPNAAVDWYETDTKYNAQGGPFEVSESKTADHQRLFMTGAEAGNIFSDVNRGVSVEEAQAKGFGSLSTMHPQMDKIDAVGIWKDGVWTVVMKRKIHTAEQGRINFSPGSSVHVAFAVWDGAYRDRNGQKMVSIWNELILEAN
ncbi:MAG: c-type cytochrome [Candidatus Omnitrophica bacterium]|nr:c-type cytochrome [Candidatus Omnitrophota bacterium]